MKYNPKNDNHRKWLAERVLKVLLGYGYVLNFDAKGEELIFYKNSECEETAIVTVYTSIDRRSGSMRWRGTDAIRISATHHYEEENGFHASAQRFYRTINRVGTLDSIAKRVAEGLRIANWNIQNLDKPRWDGQTPSKKRRRRGRIQKK